MNADATDPNSTDPFTILNRACENAGARRRLLVSYEFAKVFAAMTCERFQEIARTTRFASGFSLAEFENQPACIEGDAPDRRGLCQLQRQFDYLGSKLANNFTFEIIYEQEEHIRYAEDGHGNMDG